MSLGIMTLFVPGKPSEHYPMPRQPTPKELSRLLDGPIRLFGDIKYRGQPCQMWFNPLHDKSPRYYNHLASSYTSDAQLKNGIEIFGPAIILTAGVQIEARELK